MLTPLETSGDQAALRQHEAQLQALDHLADTKMLSSGVVDAYLAAAKLLIEARLRRAQEAKKDSQPAT